MLQKYQQMDTNFIDTEERDIFYHITNKYLQRLHTSEERTLFLLIVLEDEK